MIVSNKHKRTRDVFSGECFRQLKKGKRSKPSAETRDASIKKKMSPKSRYKEFSHISTLKIYRKVTSIIFSS